MPSNSATRLSTRLRRSVPVFGVVVALLFVATAPATVTELELAGFSIELQVTVNGNPGAVYDAMTGDVSGWWDHHFSEKPAALYIEAKPGGGFYEIFDDSGDGAKHAEVIYAERGKLLRLRGPLGLSGSAVDFVFTLRFEPEGEATRIDFTANALGQIDAKTIEVVENVWVHFLVEQFKPYLESGKAPGVHRE